MQSASCLSHLEVALQSGQELEVVPRLGGQLGQLAGLHVQRRHQARVRAGGLHERCDALDRGQSQLLVEAAKNLQSGCNFDRAGNRKQEACSTPSVSALYHTEITTVSSSRMQCCRVPHHVSRPPELDLLQGSARCGDPAGLPLQRDGYGGGPVVHGALGSVHRRIVLRRGNRVGQVHIRTTQSQLACSIISGVKHESAAARRQMAAPAARACCIYIM